MKSVLSLVGICAALGLTCACFAQDKPPATDKPNSSASEESPDVAAIRKTAATFIDAFAAGDAQAVAALWTVDGEYSDQDGHWLQGREQIAKAYEAFFAANPGIRITTHIDRLRLVGPNTAIEDGTSLTASATTEPTVASRYTAVHVKQDGQWRMASVRETPAEARSSYGHLKDLSWLIGTWMSEHEGVELELTRRWIADNFIEQRYDARRDGQSIASGVEIIGWDQNAHTVKSWAFTSDGGRATGTWTPHATGWVVESAGTLQDGTPTSAVNLLSALDDNGYAWRSVNRTAGAFRVLDTDEVVLRRKSAAPHPDGVSDQPR